MTRSLHAVMLLAVVTACSNDPSAPETEMARGLLRDRALTQVERFGLPAIATVFIPAGSRNAYNAGAPADDQATFRAFVTGTLTSFGHPDPEGLADALLPDIQPINLAVPSAFLNGRRLQDDVITAELGLIFGANAALNDDHVDVNDRPFLAAFPYLAAPHLP